MRPEALHPLGDGDIGSAPVKGAGIYEA